MLEVVDRGCCTSKKSNCPASLAWLYESEKYMSTVDLSLIELPRSQPIDDPDAYLRAAVRWHFSEDTGSPYWLERAKQLDFDPLTEVTTFADLARFPNTVDELRTVPVRDLVPKGYGPNAPTPAVYETGGTTGAPKRLIFTPDWTEHVMQWVAEENADDPRLRRSGMLVMGPTGPHLFGNSMIRLGQMLESLVFMIDFDPRWVKKLIARGDSDEAAAYVDHLIDQAGFILRNQEISFIMTTPPFLAAITRHDDLVEAINSSVVRIQLAGAHLDEDTRDILREVFPNCVLHNGYGSSMILGGAETRKMPRDDDPIIHDAHSPYQTFFVIDPSTGEPVPYGERGQVVMNFVAKNMFIPNNLERDTAIRLPAPLGRVGDSVSVIRPVESFEGERVIEGVY
jgi:acyl-CoA synthetase (AMP-forming)/AMP-acid ligase II